MTHCRQVLPIQRIAILWVALSFLLVTSGIGWSADEEEFVIAVNKARVVESDTAPGMVQVGNPKIADVNITPSDKVVVLGIEIGETSVLILDSEGQIIRNLGVVVVPKVTNRVTLHAGPLYEFLLDCTPTCTITGSRTASDGTQ